MYYIMKIGEKIKQLRKQRNISQEVLANHLGVSFQAVSKWESGVSMPDVMLLPKIANVLGITLEALYGMQPTEKRIKAEKGFIIVLSFFGYLFTQPYQFLNYRQHCETLSLSFCLKLYRHHITINFFINYDIIKEKRWFHEENIW